MKEYYVYAHATFRGEVYYVGKGKGLRLHVTGNRSGYWKKIRKQHGCRPFYLEKNLDEKEAYRKEIKWIAYYKSIGMCRANFTLGGDGVMVQKRWWGDAISKAQKGIVKPSGKNSGSYKFLNEKELVAMYNSGLSSIEIAKIFKVSPTTIIKRIRSNNGAPKEPGRKKQKVRCIEDNKVFKSINAAAAYYSVYRENIRKVLMGNYKHTGGRRFEYVQ